MDKRFINDLKEIPIVDLIFTNTKNINNKTYIDYHVVCDTPSVVSNLEECKKIIAILEIAKSLLTNDKIRFNYRIETSGDLENRIINEGYKALKIENILYSKDYYFQTILNSKNKTR